MLPFTVSRVLTFFVNVIMYVPRVCLRCWHFLRDVYGSPSQVTRVVTRAEWGAEPARERQPQESAAKHVVIAWTETERSRTREGCEKGVKDLQRQHMDAGEPDIKYNFLIGGDGNVYQGRGWRVEPSFPNLDDIHDYRGNSVLVAMMNKELKVSSRKMLKAIASLVVIGEDKKQIADGFKFSKIMNNRITLLKMSQNQ